MTTVGKAKVGLSGIFRFWGAIALIIAFYIPPVAMLVASGVLAYYGGWVWPLPGVWQGFLSGLPLPVWYVVLAVFAPRFDFQKLGIRMTPADEAELFSLIAAAARKAGARMPREVLLSFENTTLVRRSMFGRRTLLVGFFDLQVLTVSQFDALVVRELSRRHLRLLMWTGRMGLAYRRSTPSAFPDREGLIEWYTGRFWGLVTRLLKPFAAAEERFAAQIAGSDVFSEALLQTTRVHAIQDRFMTSDLGSAAEAGYVLPMTAGLQAMLADPRLTSLMDEFVRLYRSVHRRIWDLRKIAPAAERNDLPALSLLRDLPSLEAQLTRLYLRKMRRKAGDLKPLDWENRGLAVEIPLRRQFVAAHAKHLENVRLNDVFRIAREPYIWAMEMWGQTPNLRAPIVIPLESGEQQAKSLLGSAIICRLHAIGWTPVWDGGNEVMTRGDKVFDAHRTIEGIYSGELSLEQWNQQIEDLGLFPTMPLAYTSVE